MYKIIYGIPATGIPEEIKVNSHGHIEDTEFKDEDDIWCDFSLEYNCKNDYYYFSFETMLGWKEKDGCRNWIIRCLNCLTEYMDSHGLDKSKELNMYEVFTNGVSVNSHFRTIECAYAWLKMMVFGFHGQGLIIEKTEE